MGTFMQMLHQEPGKSENLSSGRRQVIAEAERPLERMGSEEADHLLAVLKEEARRRRRMRVLVKCSFGAYIGYIGILILSMLFGIRDRGHYLDDIFWVIILFSMVVGAASKVQKEAATRLAELDDIRAVGLLAETLETGDRALQAIVPGALIRLLPRLQASDAYLLDAKQRKILNRALKQARSGRNAELAEAILKAYEQVGDESSLAEVKALADLPPQRSVKIQRIADAARACLPYLVRRIEQERAAQSLLRAASAPTALPDTLLRAASGVRADAPEELLRAAAPDQAA
jgi:hypothetical protein